MINAIKRVGDELSRTWDNVAEGWQDLWQRSRNSITRFLPVKQSEAGAIRGDFPTWAVLAGEIADTGHHLVIRVEIPGIDRDDCEVTLTRNRLLIAGEKRADRELIDADYYVRERAYGRFSRSIELPMAVDPDRAHANFRSGVLTVKAPKLEAGTRRRLTVV